MVQLPFLRKTPPVSAHPSKSTIKFSTCRFLTHSPPCHHVTPPVLKKFAGSSYCSTFLIQTSRHITNLHNLPPSYLTDLHHGHTSLPTPTSCLPPPGPTSDHCHPLLTFLKILPQILYPALQPVPVSMVISMSKNKQMSRL